MKYGHVRSLTSVLDISHQSVKVNKDQGISVTHGGVWLYLGIGMVGPSLLHFLQAHSLKVRNAWSGPVGKKLCTASRVAYCTHTSLMSPTFFMSTSSVKLFYCFILLLLHLIAVVHEGLKQSRTSVSTNPISTLL